MVTQISAIQAVTEPLCQPACVIDLPIIPGRRQPAAVTVHRCAIIVCSTVSDRLYEGGLCKLGLIGQCHHSGITGRGFAH